MTVDQTTKRFRIALVGCGRISERHFDAIAKTPSLRLVAVCDDVAERARQAGEKMSVPFYTSFAQLLEERPSDVVAICTPSGLHPKHGIMAAEKGAHVICDKLGVSVWEVIDAAATKPFGFMKFSPGPGLGGHCIPLDPHYLAWKMRTLHYKTRMIELAGEINTEMPAFWVGKVADALNDVGKPMRGARILVLGVAYKKDIDDLRESPALDILDLLSKKGAEALYHDPYVPEIIDDGHTPDGAVGRSVPLNDDTLRGADAVMIVTDHSAIDYERVKRLAAIVIDSRNALSRAAARRPEPAGAAN